MRLNRVLNEIENTKSEVVGKGKKQVVSRINGKVVQYYALDDETKKIVDAARRYAEKKGLEIEPSKLPPVDIDIKSDGSIIITSDDTEQHIKIHVSQLDIPRNRKISTGSDEITKVEENIINKEKYIQNQDDVVNEYEKYRALGGDRDLPDFLERSRRLLKKKSFKKGNLAKHFMKFDQFNI